jgi:hypothetical protein
LGKAPQIAARIQKPPNASRLARFNIAGAITN